MSKDYKTKKLLTAILLIFWLSGCHPKEKIEKALTTKGEGVHKAKNGDYKEAIPLLEKASRLSFKDKEIYYYLAESYEGIRDYQKAKETWQKYLLFVDPSSHEAKTAHKNI